jgi:hypothetical protein
MPDRLSDTSRANIIINASHVLLLVASCCGRCVIEAEITVYVATQFVRNSE